MCQLIRKDDTNARHKTYEWYFDKPVTLIEAFAILDAEFSGNLANPPYPYGSTIRIGRDGTSERSNYVYVAFTSRF